MPKEKDKETGNKDRPSETATAVAEKEPTVVELAKKMNEQDEMIIDMGKRNSDLVKINETAHAEMAEVKNQVSNLTDILTNIANRGDDDGLNNELDITDKKKMDELIGTAVDAKISAYDKGKTEKQTASDKVWIEQYKKTAEQMLGTRKNPKGEKLDAKSRSEIAKMLTDKDSEFRKLDGEDPFANALINFEGAYERYYGLDKKNPFKGGDPAGTGVGGEFNPDAPTKPTYTFSDDALKQLGRAGITKEKAGDLMKNRTEREALV